MKKYNILIDVIESCSILPAKNTSAFKPSQFDALISNATMVMLQPTDVFTTLLNTKINKSAII